MLRYRCFYRRYLQQTHRDSYLENQIGSFLLIHSELEEILQFLPQVHQMVYRMGFLKELPMEFRTESQKEFPTVLQRVILMGFLTDLRMELYPELQTEILTVFLRDLRMEQYQEILTENLTVFHMDHRHVRLRKLLLAERTLIELMTPLP